MSRFGTLERDHRNFRDTELFDNSEDDNSSTNAPVHPPESFELRPDANSTNIMESYETERNGGLNALGEHISRGLLEEDRASSQSSPVENAHSQQNLETDQSSSKGKSASEPSLDKISPKFRELGIWEPSQSAGSSKIGVEKKEKKRSILNQKSATISNSGVFTNHDARTVSASNSNSIEHLQQELARSQMQIKILTDELKQAQPFSKDSSSSQPTTTSFKPLNNNNNVGIENNNWKHEQELSELHEKHEKEINELNKKLELSCAMQEEMHIEYEEMFKLHTDIIKEYETNMSQLFANLNKFIENNEEFLTMKKNYKALKMTKNCDENFEQLNKFFYENLTTIREYKLEQQRVREEALHEVSELTDDEEENKEKRDTKGNTHEHAQKEVSFVDGDGIPNEEVSIYQSGKEPGEETRYEIEIENIHTEYHNFFSHIFELLNQSDQYGRELEHKIFQQITLLKRFDSLLNDELEYTSSTVKEHLEQENLGLLTDLSEVNQLARHLDTRLAHHLKNTSNFQIDVNEICGDILVQFEKVFEPDSILLAKEKLYKHKLEIANDKSRQNSVRLLRVLQFIRAGTCSLIDEYISQLKLKNKHNAFIEIKELNKKWLLEKYKREKDLRDFEQRLSSLQTSE
ncbi:hypothetical protein ACO0QE_003863 [Hanseniaspora vineae]